MTKRTPSPSQPPPDVSARLHAVAELLREAHHLGPDAQKALAEVVEELSQTLDHTRLSAADAAHLADSAAHLADALKQQQTAPLEAARERLLEASVAAETRAPVAAGLIRQIADALSSIGI
jgi:hypothetical protein